MQIGFVLPNSWGLDSVATVTKLAIEAEERGLDSVWVNHHVVNAGYIEERLGTRPYYDALTALTWAAGLARRIPRLLEALAAEGRDRDSIVVAPRIDVSQVPDAAAVDAYRRAGADRLVVGTSSADPGKIRAGLAHAASLLA